MTTPTEEGRPVQVAGSRRSMVLLTVAVFVVAANLRPTVTSVGPVLGLIARDTGLGPAALGALGAIPLVAFGVVSPLVHGLSRRLGLERALLVALIALVAGTVLRSLPGPLADVWLGTAILGAAIAVMNVILPGVLRRDFPTRIPVMTGAYSFLLSGFAALASAVALSVAHVGGWRLAIGVWAVPALVGVAVWLPLQRRGTTPAAAPLPESAPSGGSVWRSPVAWWVTIFMGTQSTIFYVTITWLPTIEVSFGIPAVVAGWHLFTYQILSAVAGLSVPAFMQGRRDQRLVGMLVSLGMIPPALGLIFLPGLVLLWAILLGLASGSSLVVALTLVAQRARHAHDATRLSGMAQGVGYLLAALGPFGAGVLFEATGSWTPPLCILIVAAALQAIVAIPAGHDRFAH